MYHKDTIFPNYKYISIFNPELGIDNQYYVKWNGFDVFKVIQRRGKILNEIKEFRDEYNQEKEVVSTNGNNGRSRNIGEQYNRDAIVIGNRVGDRRADKISREYPQSDRGKSDKSDNYSDKRGRQTQGTESKQITGYIDGTDDNYLDAVKSRRHGDRTKDG